ncbi:hypothetical protein DP43_4328 [Burkholderia pseudomallei]|nr:hypothetical protein DP43_4328 [Burkholderia pseudomallei]
MRLPGVYKFRFIRRPSFKVCRHIQGNPVKPRYSCSRMRRAGDANSESSSMAATRCARAR